MSKAVMKSGLSAIALSPIALKKFMELADEELSMPNIPFPTMGGHVMWTTLCEANGWKIQQNSVTNHARILDDNDKRLAWGTVNGMIKVFDRFNEMNQKY